MLPWTVPERVDGSYLATDYTSVSILRGSGGVEALEELPTVYIEISARPAFGMGRAQQTPARLA
jgi:hypothetical protein